MIKTINDLEVYVQAYNLAMDIFDVTKKFPKEEKYSLTDQVRRSSRSVAVNISEGWGRRTYEQLFKKQLIDSLGSLEETKTWLNFAKDCGYIRNEVFDSFYEKSDNLGSKIYRLHENWK